jgi:hypothetical protein
MSFEFGTNYKGMFDKALTSSFMLELEFIR